MSRRILLAEDDNTLREGIAAALESEGYEVEACKDGEEAIAAFARARPDLALLDVMMPKKSGYDVCVEIQKHDGTVPVIFITAKSSEEDAVLALGLGAVDFMAKPLRLKEMLARIAVTLKWTGRGASAADGAFAIGGARIDAKRYAVLPPDGPEQPLTIRELGLLKAFAAHPGEVLSRDDLLDAVWGKDFIPASRTLDQHIVQIRRKLGAAGALIETVRGAGYRLRA